MAYQETFVQRDQHRIYVRDHPGAEPALILMHGFPDNVHLYDRLSPYLSPPRRVVLFDFLGWGSSDKPSATLTPPTIKSGTSTPSSPNWGLGKSSSSRTTPQAHRPSTGRWPIPSAWPGWCC
jgi:pimeloyl-ACP methyl ester carboxylesterase